MSQMIPFLKVLLWSLVAWATTIAFSVIAFFLAIAFTDGGRARLSTVEMAISVLQIAQMAAGCLAIAFVFYIGGRYIKLGMRIAWTILYTAIQFATTTVLVITLLAMFNR